MDKIEKERERCRIKMRKSYKKNPELWRKRGRENYWKHLEKAKAYQKEYRKQLRSLTLKYYGGENPKCACCGLNDVRFLSIDHINGGGTKERKETGGGGHHFYRQIKKQGFPNGYQVLCYNCNTAKGIFGNICPHEKDKQLLN